ncbi:DUF4013 domain-containing protein [bacterium]|nr:DUF4013 domain-containing protein [bacterium]
MNFGLGFSYIFKDEDWFKKLIVPALCMLIPVVGWMVTMGWALRVTRNVMDGVEKPLPELNFGDDILRGLFAFLISFIYQLPVSILTSISGGVDYLRVFGNGEMTWAFGLFTGTVGLVAFLLGLFTTFLSLGAIANYVKNDDFSAAFRLGEVWQIVTANVGDWILVMVGLIIAVGLIGPLGTIACVIGVFLTLTYGMAVTSHLLGQAYVRSQPNLDPVVEVVDEA